MKTINYAKLKLTGWNKFKEKNLHLFKNTPLPPFRKFDFDALRTVLHLLILPRFFLNKSEMIGCLLPKWNWCVFPIKTFEVQAFINKKMKLCLPPS